MATLDPKTNVWGLYRSEFYQKHYHNIIKPNHDKTAAYMDKNAYFKGQI